MLEKLRDSKWGPWLTPAAVVMLLAILQRLEACNYSPSAIRDLAESNATRIEALETIQKAQQATMMEHLKLSEARIQLQDSEKMKLALVEQSQQEMRQDSAEIKQFMGRLEDKIDVLYGAAIRRGDVRR